MKDELKNEFADYLYNVCLLVQEDVFQSVINISNEVSCIFDSIAVMIELTRKNEFDSPFGKALVYGTSLSICSTIEKILRNIYFEEIKGDVYRDLEKVSLSSMFKENKYLSKLSEGLLYYLEFYLVKEVSYTGHSLERPGLNIRNKLMHGQNDAYENTYYGNCLHLFYMLISLINDLLLKTRLFVNEII